VLFGQRRSAGPPWLARRGDSRTGKPLALLLGNDSPLARMVETAYAGRHRGFADAVALDLTADEEPNRLIVIDFSRSGRDPYTPRACW